MEEIETNITRTAYSPIVYEVRDFCVAILDKHGRMICQGRGGIPAFLADLGYPVGDGLATYGPDGFEPGDLIITNHAGTCGQHLNNIVSYSPLIWNGELLGFMVLRVHWVDVGGRFPGGWVSDTTDIFQEGFQVRTVKLIKRGEFDQEILRILRHNMRYPEQSFGDMRSQIAGCRLGERRFLDLVERYGKETVLEAIQVIWDQSEATTRQAIAGIPDGEYSAESFLDDDGVNDGQAVRVKAVVRVSGTDLEVDLSECSDQVRGPINSGYGGLVAARIALMYLVPGDRAPDEGTFRPLRVTIPPGKFVSAQEPAAMAQWSAPLPTVIDTILRALGQAVTGLPGAHHGEVGGYAFYGRDREDRHSFYHIDTMSGGWGGHAGGDGVSALKSMVHGDTYTTSIEVEETGTPLEILRFALRPDSGGAGRHRGGLGTERHYVIPGGGALNVGLLRTRCAPWGNAGGLPGAPSRVLVRAPGGEWQEVNRVTGYPLAPASEVLVLSGGGGGFGDPFDRPVEEVAADVRAGYVTPESARQAYGVVFDPSTLSADPVATARRRQVGESRVKGRR